MLLTATRGMYSTSCGQQHTGVHGYECRKERVRTTTETMGLRWPRALLSGPSKGLLAAKCR